MTGPVERVAALAAECAVQADAAGRMDPRVVDAVLEAGFARHFVPRRWGGVSGTFDGLLGAVVRLGRACPSTAWIASLAAAVGRMAGYLPTEGQRQVWRDGPDTLVVASLLPTGTATEHPGGWRVRGRWPFVSAVEFSQWALVMARIRTGVLVFAVPRAAYTIERTWSNVGMRATGSHSLVLDDVIVPAGCCFSQAELEAGTPIDSDSAFHRVPFRAVTALSFVAPILGAAQGVLRLWTERVRTRIHAGSGPLPDIERASCDETLARSAGEIDCAELLLTRAVRAADQGGVTPMRTETNARDCALATELLVSATNRVVRTAGTSAMSGEDPLQRLWRDVNSAASHGTLRFVTKANRYANVVFGSDLEGVEGGCQSP